MADIELRFHKDMLVLSAPLAYALERQGVDVEADGEFVSLIEPETVQDAFKLETLAGAHCLVTDTAGITQARLAHKRMEDRAGELAQAAIEHVLACKPQHVLCEIGPCGLPLDATSKGSVKQSVAQYADATRALIEGGKAALGGEGGTAPIDGIFLNGLRTNADVSCGLQGVKQAFSGPVFVSLDIDEAGLFDGKPLSQATDALQGASVIGICSAADPATIASQIAPLCEATDVPLMVQIAVRQATAAEKRKASLGAPLPENPYALPDFLADAAIALRAAGVQFLRACGQATPACTGALAAGVFGLDSIR